MPSPECDFAVPIGGLAPTPALETDTDGKADDKWLVFRLGVEVVLIPDPEVGVDTRCVEAEMAVELEREDDAV